MKATKLTLHLVAGLLCAGLTGNAVAGVIFSDDFSGGASNWNNERGNWVVASGAYDASSPNNTPPTFSSAKTAALTDFIVEVDVLGLDDGGIWLRSNFDGNDASGVLLVTGGWGGSYDGVYWHVVTNDSYGAAQAYGPVSGLQGTNARVRVEVQNNTYTAYVNGTLASTLVDTTYSSGLVGLYDFSSAQRFDNVSISTFYISTLGNGTPSIPEPTTIALLGLGLAGLGFSRRRT